MTEKGRPLLQSPVFKTMRPYNLEQTRAAFREMELLPSYTPRAHGLLITTPRPLARSLMATFIPQPCDLIAVLFLLHNYSRLLKSHSTISVQPAAEPSAELFLNITACPTRHGGGAACYSYQRSAVVRLNKRMLFASSNRIPKLQSAETKSHTEASLQWRCSLNLARTLVGVSPPDRHCARQCSLPSVGR